jgi:hypothetical protein
MRRTTTYFGAVLRATGQKVRVVPAIHTGARQAPLFKFRTKTGSKLTWFWPSAFKPKSLKVLQWGTTPLPDVVVAGLRVLGFDPPAEEEEGEEEEEEEEGAPPCKRARRGKGAPA